MDMIDKATESVMKFRADVLEPYVMHCVGEGIAVEIFQLPSSPDGCTTRYEVRQVRTGFVLRRFEHVIEFKVGD